ncbi:penicillin-binding protein 2 [Egibacter rhizosphaerae]|uniref:Penicillin-binding protein 2 n=1 Tax=Egibacter rhizosphaerae TaxID=1670831 RepID=A0A411YFG5_9ACTN|nr:penicillin-binding protein 2 [Egibacter rhizosphaerae]QBI19985.1 penicillin-binding protein 2 [Egibacter rhizosphaerae]
MMATQIRRVAIVFMVLFAAVFVNLNVLAVVQGSSLREDPENTRGLIREYAEPRGLMIAGDGEEAISVARSEESEGGRLRYLRRYPEGAAYAHITGYHSFIYGRSELESAYTDELSGRGADAFARNLADLLAGQDPVGDTLRLEIEPSVQDAAIAGLEGNTGAIVALEPDTGAVLALASSPWYDPNPLASHDVEEVTNAWEELEADESNPALNRAVRETYAPGSTFKLVTSAAALENGYSLSSTFDDPTELALPQTTATISNFDGGPCADGSQITLEDAFAQSCNTTFGQLGLDLGGDTLVDTAEAFGVAGELDFDLPGVAPSAFPREDLDEPGAAQSAIGQRDVRMTPLQMALISSAAANDGELMQPRLVRHVEDASGRVVASHDPEPLRVGGLVGGSAHPISSQTARGLRAMMVAAVEDGTGTSAQIEGVEVGGKTGTAEGVEGRDPIAWFTGFATSEDTDVVVAVVITDGGADASGGTVAAPVARSVLEAALP